MVKNKWLQLAELNQLHKYLKELCQALSVLKVNSTNGKSNISAEMSTTVKNHFFSVVSAYVKLDKNASMLRSVRELIQRECFLASYPLLISYVQDRLDYGPMLTRLEATIVDRIKESVKEMKK